MRDLVGIGRLVGCGLFIYKYIRDRCERLFTCSSYIKFFRITPYASMDINARISHVPYPYIYSTPYTHSRGCRAMNCLTSKSIIQKGDPGDMKTGIPLKSNSMQLPPGPYELVTVSSRSQDRNRTCCLPFGCLLHLTCFGLGASPIRHLTIF